MARYGPKPSTPEERFWKHVEPGEPDECWEWTGALVNGYGNLYVSHSPMRFVKAHRLSWQIHNGEIPEGKHVLHHCDNPPCVNPAHLYIGGPAENARDRGVRKRGRESREKGESSSCSKLTEAQVRGVIDALRELPRRSQAEVAREFGISQGHVSRIMLRQTWSHLWSE